LRYSLFALLIALTVFPSCGRPEDPLWPDLDLPVLGTVGMHARELPEPRVVVNLFPDGRLTLNGREIEAGDLGKALAVEADRKRDLESPWEVSGTNLVIRADRRVEWDRVRKVIGAACDPDVRMYRHFLAVVHEGDGEEGTFQFRFPGPRLGHSHVRLPPGNYVRITGRFTGPAPPESIVSAVGTPAKAVLVDPDPGVPADYVLRLLDVLTRTGHEEISLAWGTTAAGPGPFGMRLNGDPVLSTSADLPAVPRSTGIVGIEFPPYDSIARFADGQAIDRLVVTVLDRGGSREDIEEKRRRLDGWARRQTEGGYWRAPDGSDVRTTGIVLLGFLAAGRTHKAGEYRRQVKAGLRFLKQKQAEDGRFATDPADHAIAAWAMTKAYALTRSPLFRQSAQQGLAALSSGGGPFGVLARAEGAHAGLVPREEGVDVRAALREALAEPYGESDPREILALEAVWLFPDD